MRVPEPDRCPATSMPGALLERAAAAAGPPGVDDGVGDKSGAAQGSPAPAGR